MATSCLSLISFYEIYIRRFFTSTGLSPITIDIDAETTLHLWGPKPGFPATGKPPLVLIHGFGPTALFQWRHQVQSLSPHFTLYIPDLIFFGKSTTSSPERSEIFQAVSVGKALEKLGVERFSVMGTSYGGFVAYHMAVLWPLKVEKVVIASSAVNKKRKDNVELLERGKVERIEELLIPKTAKELRTLLRLVIYKPPSLIPDFLLNDFLGNQYSEYREEKAELLKGVTLGKDDTSHISPLQQDVLIVWGEHDQIFLLEKAFELKELLGEKAILEVIKNTSHIPQIEDSERFNGIVKKFLCGSS